MPGSLFRALDVFSSSVGSETPTVRASEGPVVAILARDTPLSWHIECICVDEKRSFGGLVVDLFTEAEGVFSPLDEAFPVTLRGAASERPYGEVERAVGSPVSVCILPAPGVHPCRGARLVIVTAQAAVWSVRIFPKFGAGSRWGWESKFCGFAFFSRWIAKAAPRLLVRATALGENRSFAAILREGSIAVVDIDQGECSSAALPRPAKNAVTALPATVQVHGMPLDAVFTSAGGATSALVVSMQPDGSDGPSSMVSISFEYVQCESPTGGGDKGSHHDVSDLQAILHVSRVNCSGAVLTSVPHSSAGRLLPGLFWPKKQRLNVYDSRMEACLFEYEFRGGFTAAVATERFIFACRTGASEVHVFSRVTSVASSRQHRNAMDIVHLPFPAESIASTGNENGLLIFGGVRPCKFLLVEPTDPRHAFGELLWRGDTQGAERLALQWNLDASGLYTDVAASLFRNGHVDRAVALLNRTALSAEEKVMVCLGANQKPALALSLASQLAAESAAPWSLALLDSVLEPAVRESRDWLVYPGAYMDALEDAWTLFRHSATVVDICEQLTSASGYSQELAVMAALACGRPLPGGPLAMSGAMAIVVAFEGGHAVDSNPDMRMSFGLSLEEDGCGEEGSHAETGPVETSHGAPVLGDKGSIVASSGRNGRLGHGDAGREQLSIQKRAGKNFHLTAPATILLQLHGVLSVCGEDSRNALLCESESSSAWPFRVSDASEATGRAAAAAISPLDAAILCESLLRYFSHLSVHVSSVCGAMVDVMVRLVCVVPSMLAGRFAAWLLEGIPSLISADDGAAAAARAAALLAEEAVANSHAKEAPEYAMPIHDSDVKESTDTAGDKEILVVSQRQRALQLRAAFLERAMDGKEFALVVGDSGFLPGAPIFASFLQGIAADGQKSLDREDILRAAISTVAGWRDGQVAVEALLHAGLAAGVDVLGDMSRCIPAHIAPTYVRVLIDSILGDCSDSQGIQDTQMGTAASLLRIARSAASELDTRMLRASAADVARLASDEVRAQARESSAVVVDSRCISSVDRLVVFCCGHVIPHAELPLAVERAVASAGERFGEDDAGAFASRFDTDAPASTCPSCAVACNPGT